MEQSRDITVLRTRLKKPEILVASSGGIKDVRTVNPNATLAEMGMDSVMAVEIKQTVETTFDVFLTAEDVRNLSLASLEAMTNQSSTDKETNTPQIENSPTDTKMFEFSSQLLDLLKRDIVYERGIQLMESLPGIKEVFLFPGMEGTADTFSEFSAKLRAKSAKCLQTGYCERKMSSVSQLAAFFLPHVLNCLQVSGASFVFVGHSYGGLIALELSSLLEAYGHRGVIILLDSSPHYLRKAILRTLGHDCSMAVLMHLLILVGYSKTQIVDKKCAELTEWTQKLEIALIMLKSSDLGHSVTVRPFLTTVYHRITEMSTYEPSYKRINSDIILIKAKETPHFDENDSYGIEEMSKNFEVHVVDATHFSLLKKQDVVDIINKRIMTQQEKTSDFEIIQKSCFTHQENVICNGYTKQQ